MANNTINDETATHVSSSNSSTDSEAGESLHSLPPTAYSGKRMHGSMVTEGAIDVRVRELDDKLEETAKVRPGLFTRKGSKTAMPQEVKQAITVEMEELWLALHRQMEDLSQQLSLATSQINERLLVLEARHREVLVTQVTTATQACSQLQQDLASFSTDFTAKLDKESNHRECLAHRVTGDLSTAKVDWDGQLRHLSAALSAQVSVLYAHQGALLEHQERRLDAGMAVLRDEINSRCNELREANTRCFEEAGESLQHVATDMVDRAKRSEDEFHGHLKQMGKKLDDACKDYRDMHVTSTSELGTRLADTTSEHERRLGQLEVQAKLLDEALAMVSNIPTRRIDWRLHSMTRWLLSAPNDTLGLEQPLCWSSQEFEAAGVSGLKIELRYWAGGPHSCEQGQSKEQGDSSFRVWAPDGLFLVCRLHLGGASVQLQHHFKGEGPFCSRPIGLLRDQVHVEDDTVLISFEVLEAAYECPDTRLVRTSPNSAMADKASIFANTIVHRYLNNRVLDLVQSQVDLMSSRMVKRIEWRVEQASSLRSYFEAGESLCSTAFDAAGLKGLQFVFYPLGHVGAKEGFCSLFVFCPDGSLLKCVLHVGKQRRETRMSFDHQTFVGRTNFCRLDCGMDAAGDSLLLALEIEEAQMSTKEPQARQVLGFAETAVTSEKSLKVPGLQVSKSPRAPSRVEAGRPRPAALPSRPQTTDAALSDELARSSLWSCERPARPHSVAGSGHLARPRLATVGAADFEVDASDATTQGSAKCEPRAQEEGVAASGPSQRGFMPFTSSLRLQRAVGRIGLEDVRQLPSVWTDKAPGSKVTSSLEEFHKFGLLKSVRRPLGNREVKHIGGGTGSSTPEELPLRVQSEARQSPNLSRAERSERSERTNASTRRYEMYTH